jgi:hypothetical protein
MAKRETNEERWNRESLEIYEAVRKVVDGADTNDDTPEGLTKWQAFDHIQTRRDAGEALRHVQWGRRRRGRRGRRP